MPKGLKWDIAEIIFCLHNVEENWHFSTLLGWYFLIFGQKISKLVYQKEFKSIPDQTPSHCQYRASLKTSFFVFQYWAILIKNLTSMTCLDKDLDNTRKLIPKSKTTAQKIWTEKSFVTYPDFKVNFHPLSSGLEIYTKQILSDTEPCAMTLGGHNRLFQTVMGRFLSL